MNDKMPDIVRSNYFSFQEYKEKVEKYFSTDNRELNYQNRVIIPLLEKIFINEAQIDVVDVSTQYKNWERRTWHERSKYAGTYTPDILVAKNWNLYNQARNDIEYLLLIEVKAPNARDRKHAMKEVSEYLERVRNVILTNSITWEFYTNTTDKPCIYYLEDEETKVCERGPNSNINWKRPPKSNTEYLLEELKLSHETKIGLEPNIWKELLDKLRDTINIK